LRIETIWLSLKRDFLIATSSITHDQRWQKCLLMTCSLFGEAYDRTGGGFPRVQACRKDI
jgi:hypothetical protein